MSLPGAEMGTETVEAVRFGIYTDDEIRKLSIKKITNRELLNNVGQAELDGYDPALGPVDDYSICKTCGQRSFLCTGHCGHIDLVQVIYHPLLFNTLRRILQNTCLKCYHFKAEKEEVQSCVAKLNLIKEGDIIGSRMFESPSMDSDSEHELGGVMASHNHTNGQCKWTSLQLTEALSILHVFLRKRSNKCHCGAKNPAITNPTFGWLQVNDMLDEDIRSNAMKGFMDDSPIGEDDYDRSASEMENADSQNSGHVASKKRKGKTNDTSSEFSKSKTKRSFLPAEVRAILARLWEEEAELCSFIGDIQQQQLPSQKKFSFRMFFMNTLLVPPTKFRPPSKGGDSVMEHP